MAKNKKHKKNMKEKEKVENIVGSNDNWYGKIIVILVVVCVLCLFYLLTVHITSKESSSSTEKETTEEVQIQYNEILVGSTFKKSDDKYFVLYYDMSDAEVAQNVSSAISGYEAKEDALPLYVVDMSNVMNKKYVATAGSNKNPKDASSIAIDGVTLIRVKDGKVDKYIESEDEVIDYLSK